MAQNKTLTGYPSIDKPWLKYYSEESINAPLPECSVYEYLYENNRQYMNETAINYFGRKISYRVLFENIDAAANAFRAFGVKNGEIVSGITLSTPEAIYAFYALNKIGAVTNWLDPRKTPEEVVDSVKTVDSKVCIVLDALAEKFGDTLNDLGVKVIYISINNSLPLVAKAVMSLKAKRMKRRKNCISWSYFLKVYNKEKAETVSFEKNRVAVLEHTGGTTGNAKMVMLTNENLNSIVEQYRLSGMEVNRGESWLAVAFPFIAYALVCSQHMPLSLGICANLCLSTGPEKIKRQITKTRCNHMANTPVVWEEISEMSSARKMDCSFLINPTVGADTLDISKEQKINEFLEKRGCKYKLTKGYGMTEVSSGASVTTTNDVNKLGSVGIPMCWTTIAIFDAETGEELTYNKQGEICISGPAVMLGYYQNEEETKNILRKHNDGRLWIHSGDLGHMDEDGFLFIDGRIKRMFIDSTGFKIFPFLVETELNKVPGVEKSCVVGVTDIETTRGQKPVAFLLPVKGVDREELLYNIKKHMEESVLEYARPTEYIFVEEFPYTGAGKVDWREMERRVGEKM